MTNLKLNPKLFSDSFKYFKKSIQNDESFELNDDKYIIDPFSVGSITDFITMSHFDYESIISKLKSTKLNEKNNDLYKFRQSKDFKILKKSAILQDIRAFFLNAVLPWMKEVSGIELFDNEIDITYSVYKNTDYLLCHDDHLEARRIAFVWYLVDENWTEENGGHLDLISEDEFGEPREVTKSFLPIKNNFIFFKVANNSYHQVREIKILEDSLERSRISINGWFRGPSLTWKDVAMIPAPARLTALQIEENLLYDWINIIYLQDQTSQRIRKDFIEASEVQLFDFLNKEKYNDLVQSLDTMEFSLTGPMNVRQIYLPLKGEAEYPECVKQITRLLKSDAMMVLLSDMTNLNLHSAAQKHSDNDTVDEDEEPILKKSKVDEDGEISVGTVSDVQIRHFKNGCYTLLRDNDQRHKECRLELYLSVGFTNEEDKDDLSNGGYYSYFAEGEDDELLTIVPTANALSLIYADDQTMGFMKYITKGYEINDSKNEIKDKLYDFHSTYYECE